MGTGEINTVVGAGGVTLRWISMPFHLGASRNTSSRHELVQKPGYVLAISQIIGMMKTLPLPLPCGK